MGSDPSGAPRRRGTRALLPHLQLAGNHNRHSQALRVPMGLHADHNQWQPHNLPKHLGSLGLLCLVWLQAGITLLLRYKDNPRLPRQRDHSGRGWCDHRLDALRQGHCHVIIEGKGGDPISRSANHRWWLDASEFQSVDSDERIRYNVHSRVGRGGCRNRRDHIPECELPSSLK